MSESDLFAGREPLPGLEHLGRAITDAAGIPSGSPANFEATRGRPNDAVLTETDRIRILNDLAAEFGGERVEPAAHPWAKSEEPDSETPGGDG